MTTEIHSSTKPSSSSPSKTKGQTPGIEPRKRSKSSSSSRKRRRRKFYAAATKAEGVTTTKTTHHPSKKRPRGFRRELSSGGIIYRKRENKIEFFFIRDPYGRWTFPKGHQELGETLVETAIREVDEETGLRGLHYLAPLGKTLFRFRRGRTTVEKTVYLFLFEVPSETKENLPGTEGIMEAQWFPLEKAKKMSGYGNLDRLLAKAIAISKQHVHSARPRASL